MLEKCWHHLSSMADERWWSWVLWCCKMGNLYRAKRILNMEGFHCIFQHNAIPCGWHLIGVNFVLQQDHKPKQQHSTKPCRTILWKKQSAGTMSIMEASQPYKFFGDPKLLIDRVYGKMYFISKRKKKLVATVIHSSTMLSVKFPLNCIYRICHQGVLTRDTFPFFAIKWFILITAMLKSTCQKQTRKKHSKSILKQRRINISFGE